MTFNFKTISAHRWHLIGGSAAMLWFLAPEKRGGQATGAIRFPLQTQPEKPSVSVHRPQIRQHMQTGNKGWVNTSPDYCQRGNMRHVLLSVLIIKKMCWEWSYKMEATVNSQWQGNIRLYRFHLFTAWHFLPSAECALTVCQWPHHLNWTHMNI